MEANGRASFAHKALTHQIIGAAMEVLNVLRPGLNERVYEKALIVELLNQGVRLDQQTPYPVYYKEQLVGTLIPDLVVGGAVVVDTKVVESFHDAHVAQVLGYLSITGLEVGLLLNFKYAKLHWKRLARNAAERTVPVQYDQPEMNV